jgi:hypothetical protein
MSFLANTAKYLGFDEILNSTKAITAGILSGTGLRIAKATNNTSNNIALRLVEQAKNIYDKMGGETFSRVVARDGTSHWVPTFSAGFKPGFSMSKSYLNNWWSSANGWQRAARVGALGGGIGSSTYMGYRGVRHLLGRDQ